MGTIDRGEFLEKVQEQARLLLQPLDLKDLATRGILVKEGAWYRILKFNALPDHAFARISEIAQDSRGSKVKFLKLSMKATADLKKMNRKVL